MGGTSIDCLQLETKNPSSSSLESALFVCKKGCFVSQEKKNNPGGKPITAPLPRSQGVRKKSFDMSSSTSKVDIEKFDGSNDFGLWKMKMLAHLGNLGLAEALGGASKLPATMNDEEKEEVLKKAYNTLILNINDKVLREIVKTKSAAEVWLKLESLYMTKNLSNRLYIKERFFTCKMAEGNDLQDHIDDFNKLIMDLENIGVEYEDEDKALILLHSLPKSYENFVDILQYGRETISLDDVVGALKYKEYRRKSEMGEHSCNGLAVKGRPSKKESKGKQKVRSKSQGGKKTVRCFVCYEEGHIKKDCSKKKKDGKPQDGSGYNSTR